MPTTLEESAARMQLALRNMQLRLAKVINHCLEAHGLTIPQFQALSFLDEQGPIAMNLLATELGVPRPTATHLVDRLVTAGLASRQKLQEDRRVVQVALDEGGRQALDQIREQFSGYITALLSGLPPTEREGLVCLSEQFSQMLMLAGEMV